MKTKILSLTSLIMFGFLTVVAENKIETFIVKGGDCDECKMHIEKSALLVYGVSIADWDKESKKLQVVFDDSKTNVDAIQKAIAEKGNDTPNHKAGDEAYDRLPQCCKYER